MIRLPFGPLITALIASFSGWFRSHAALQLEVLALRHQIGVLQRSVKRPKLTSADRLLWVWLCSVWPDWRFGLRIIKASTVVGCHRKGFRLFWTWKIRQGKKGRPVASKEVRELIRTMSRENPLWGAPKIHGELLKLGIGIGETSVSNYMVRRRRPPSQMWKTFLDNHVKSMVSVDFLAVPTIRFDILYVFLVLAHERRRIVHFAVTAHPTADWTAQQMREAFPWDDAPRYLLRDRDRIFGKDFVDQVKAMGIKQVLSAPRSPWQRAYVERLIATLRRECLDHMIVFSERCLYRHLKSFTNTTIAAAPIWRSRRTARSPTGPKRTHAWIFFGSDIGSPGQRNRIHSSDDALEEWAVAECKKKGSLSMRKSHTTRTLAGRAALFNEAEAAASQSYAGVISNTAPRTGGPMPSTLVCWHSVVAYGVFFSRENVGKIIVSSGRSRTRGRQQAVGEGRKKLCSFTTSSSRVTVKSLALIGSAPAG